MKNVLSLFFLNQTGAAFLLLDIVKGGNEYNAPGFLGLLGLGVWVWSGREMFDEPKEKLGFDWGFSKMNAKKWVAFGVMVAVIVLAVIAMWIAPVKELDIRAAWEECMAKYSIHPDMCGGAP